MTNAEFIDFFGVSGVWYSYHERSDGLVDYQIYVGHVEIEFGIMSRRDLEARVDATDAAVALPLQ